MLVKKKRKNSGGEIPTASLPDIVFMLLLFFLVTTTIDMDKGLGMVLPEEGNTTEVNPKNITNILVNASGKIAVSHEGDIQVIDVRELKHFAKRSLATNDKMIFSVKTAATSKYKDYIVVIDQLKQASATRISIADPES
ncbi:MAG: biopolymer transporter ExbD [Candidatus Marinimicrobia bacterium]|nr:biopolymer transporter ExbD [Candidatus Neomarinimicrobiota bacterium]